MLVGNLEQPPSERQKVPAVIVGTEKHRLLAGEIIAEGENVCVAPRCRRKAPVVFLQEFANMRHGCLDEVWTKRQVQQPGLHPKHVHDAAGDRVPTPNDTDDLILARGPVARSWLVSGCW